MEYQEYEKLKEEYDVYRQKIKAVIDRHYSDTSLFHPVGEDKWCLYCEQYNDYNERLKVLSDQIQAFESTQVVEDPRVQYLGKDKDRKRYFNVYAVKFKDRTQYLVWGFSIRSIVSKLTRKQNMLESYSVIPPELYDSIYLETKHRAVIKLDQVMEKVRPETTILAKRSKSKIRLTGDCYNKQPFQYIRYVLNSYKRVKALCEGHNVTMTKKFLINGLLRIETPKGAFSLKYGEVIVKISKDIFVVMSNEEFDETFELDEPKVWVESIE